MKTAFKVLLFMAIVFSHPYVYSQLDTPYDDFFWSQRESAMAAYEVPEPTDSRYEKIVYIDPSKGTNGAGTEADPLNAWPATLDANTAYLQKRGTECNGSLGKQNNDNILIGAYGSGERPNLGMNDDDGITIMGDSAVIRDIKVKGVGLGKWPYIETDKHWIYNCELNGIGVFASLTYTKIIGNILHDALGELIWVSGAEENNKVGYNVEIAWNHLYNANMRWFPGATEKEAPGDAIQFKGANGLVNIHHNVIDRSSTGNKFNIILGEPISPVFDAIVSNNVFYGPKRTSEGGATLYFKRIIGKCTVANNIFYDDEGDGMSNVWSEDGDLEFYGNLVKGLYQDINIKANTYYNNTIIDNEKINGHNSDIFANNIFWTNYNSKLGDKNIYIDEVGADNLFADQILYRLKEDGPAIKSGDEISDMEWEKDYFGTPIPQNGKIDMGAYQYTNEILNVLAQDSQRAAFDIYPNPANNFIQISTGAQGIIGDMQIFRLSGQIVNANLVTKNSQGYDISNLVPGVYLVKIKTAEGEKTQKLIKK